jgi:hypothetical protein
MFFASMKTDLGGFFALNGTFYPENHYYNPVRPGVFDFVVQNGN